MPDPALGALLGLALALGCAGVYVLFRGHGWPVSVSAALSVPLTQAVFSVAFQAGFLAGWPVAGAVLALGFLGWSGIRAAGSRRLLAGDARCAADFVRSFPLFTLPLLLCIAYTLAQALLLPIKSQDGLIYHLPRVFLFIQSNSFFLDAFNRYHEVIFPVGFDILYYPFVALGTVKGLPLLNLANYCAIGACVYALSRLFAGRRESVLAVLVVLSLTGIALQAASVKNDLGMATVAGAGLLLVLRSPAALLPRTFLLLGFLCAFGVSIKTTFLAFFPGLGLLAIIRFRLYNPARLQILTSGLLKNWKLVLCVLVPSLIASQIWLFAWNAANYETWSGPLEFTQRHTQDDGLFGTAANSVRYSLEILQVGSITDTLGSTALRLPQFSRLVHLFYAEAWEPLFGNAGMSREPFDVGWITHEDYAWFGPLGAFMFFFCLPLALVRRPDTRLALLPAIVYFLMLAAQISWMPWNGRFFPAFFVALTPALAVTLARFDASRLFLGAITAIAITSLFTVKTIDFARPVFPITRALYFGDLSTPISTLFEAMRKESNAWSRSYPERELHRGKPSRLLTGIPSGSRIGLYMKGHDENFGYFVARPDLRWYPLNIVRAVGRVHPKEIPSIFLTSELDYLLLIREPPGRLEPHVIAASEDRYSFLVAHPRHFTARESGLQRPIPPPTADEAR